MRITLHHEARRAAVQAPHRCVACGYQGTASGSVSWRLRRAFGLPMRVFQVETELTCPGCGARAVRLTRARVDRWVAGMRDIADSDAIVAADYRCTRGRCTSTLAFLDRDGRVLALARAPARPDKNPANPVGDRLRARRQADEVAPPAPRPDTVAP